MNKDEQVKEEIIEAARIVFKRYGYKKATIEDIATEAGKGKSSLYYYFKNKEEIFKEVLNTEWNLLMKMLRENLKGKNSLSEKMQAYIQTRVKATTEFAIAYMGMRSEHLQKYKFVQEFRWRNRDMEAGFLVQIFREAAEKGELRLDDEHEIEVAAFAITSSLMGVQEWIVNESSEEEFPTPPTLNIFADLILYGIAKT